MKMGKWEIGNDKILHAGGTALIVLFCSLFGTWGTMSGIIVAIAVSLGKEAWDRSQGREFSIKDLCADYVGIAVAAVLVLGPQLVG